MDLREINKKMPPGKVQVKEGFLKSKAIPPSKRCFISGRFDIASELGDGSWGIIDFKITDPTNEKIQKFFAQLHAYKFALENPSFGKAKKVSKMGIVAINPEEISFPGEKVLFKAEPKYFEIKEDMDRFFTFIEEVTKLLEAPMPKTNDRCLWCKYRLCFTEPEQVQEDLPF
jgi:hypothetical protein